MSNLFTIDGKPVCYYQSPAPLDHSDGKKHFYPSLVTFDQPGHSLTDWDYGTDYELAKQVVEKLNRDRGTSPKAASLIVASSMFYPSRITYAEIQSANES